MIEHWNPAKKRISSVIRMKWNGWYNLFSQKISMKFANKTAIQCLGEALFFFYIRQEKINNIHNKKFSNNSLLVLKTNQTD